MKRPSENRLAFIPIQKSKLTRRRATDSTHVRQGEATKLGYFFGLVSDDISLVFRLTARLGKCPPAFTKRQYTSTQGMFGLKVLSEPKAVIGKTSG